MAQYALVKCNINGKDVEKIVDVRASLTDMLRNDFRLTSVKKGCEVGECGACTALIDGEAINTCLYLAVWAEGKHIVTLEGLMNPDGTVSDIQKAFMDETAIQCGFCTPGFILTATEILASGKEYTDDELRKLLSGHLCRCTGYQKCPLRKQRALCRSACFWRTARVGGQTSPFACLARCRISSAATLMAISAGISAWIGRPMGAWMRVSASSGMPFFIRKAFVAAIFFRLPMQPM